MSPDNTSLQKREEKRNRPAIPTKWRIAKLWVTLGGLVVISAGALGSIIYVGAAKEPLLLGAFAVNRGWLMAVLGGAVGGLARALYFLMFDNYAFHYRERTGESSPYVRMIYRLMYGDTCFEKYGEIMDDDYDPLHSWYSYFVKTLIGATLGLLFALTVELGLITLAGEVRDEEKRAIRLMVLAGIAGLFAENVHQRLQAFLVKGT